MSALTASDSTEAPSSSGSVTAVSALAHDLRRADSESWTSLVPFWLALTRAFGFGLTSAAPSDRHARVRDAVATIPDPAAHRIADALASGDVEAAAQSTRDVAAAMEDAGALSLADVLLRDATTALAPLAPHILGRILAQRGRLARQCGDAPLARARYERVAELGRTTRDLELSARAEVGFGVLAITRGNYPDAERHFTRAARSVDRARRGGGARAAEIRDVATAAHHGCLVLAGRRGESSRALVHGWLAFEHATGDTLREAEMLSNVGAVLADAGDPAAALAALNAALSRQPVPRIALPALGGLARAAARLGRVEEVRDAASRIGALIDQSALPYPAADAALAAAVALTAIGDEAAADRFRQHASQLADRYGFHEIRMAVDAVSEAPAPVEPSRVTWSSAAAPIRRRVIALAEMGPLHAHEGQP